jgi:hypothetical protein
MQRAKSPEGTIYGIQFKVFQAQVKRIQSYQQESGLQNHSEASDKQDTPDVV